MTLEELICHLTYLSIKAEDYDSDKEELHIKADQLLLDFINNENVTKAFHNIDKWYA